MRAGCNEEGDACGLDNCRGRLTYGAVLECSCHISAPCTNCVDNPLTCPVCGWTETREPTRRVVDIGCGIGEVTYRPGPLDRTRIDYRTRTHSSCTMIKEGCYPEGATRRDVEMVVRGTFGGRFERFGNGTFRYIAYTD